MSTASLAKSRRIPREGCFFAGLRILAVLAKILGALTLIGGIIGTVSTFFKSASDIFSALQYLDQGFAWFVLTLIGTYFGVFGGLSCLGLLVISLGFVLDFVSTKPGGDAPIDKPPPTA